MLSCYYAVTVRVRASVLSLVPCHGDCPLELTKVVSESERVALCDGIVSLREKSQQWFLSSVGSSHYM